MLLQEALCLLHPLLVARLGVSRLVIQHRIGADPAGNWEVWVLVLWWVELKLLNQGSELQGRLVPGDTVTSAPRERCKNNHTGCARWS